ncbi:MAG: hypothetical protein ABIK47_07345 [candidate division WOR-3 bacterium]
MCCRACAGYELCRTKGKLNDECCPECQYYDSCMEEFADEENRHRPRNHRFTRGRTTKQQ